MVSTDESKYKCKPTSTMTLTHLGSPIVYVLVVGETRAHETYADTGRKPWIEPGTSLLCPPWTLYALDFYNMIINKHSKISLGTQGSCYKCTTYAPCHYRLPFNTCNKSFCNNNSSIKYEDLRRHTWAMHSTNKQDSHNHKNTYNSLTHRKHKIKYLI